MVSVRTVFYCLVFCCFIPLWGDEKPTMDDQERELKTWIDRTKKKLISHNCEPVSETNYPEIHKDICDMAVVCGIEKPEIFLVDADSPAGVALNVENIYFFNNAWVFSRSGITTLIIVDKGLFEFLTPEELKSIIAHEFSHIVYKKDWFDYEERLARVVRALGIVGVFVPMAYAVYVVKMSEDRAASGGEILKVCGAYGVALMSMFVSNLFLLWRCRNQEKDADLSAIRLTKSKALASALEKMRKRFAELYPVVTRNFAWYEKWMPWNLDHPTLAKRKKYIEAHDLSQQER